MRVIPRLVAAFRSLFRSRQLERDLDDELRGYADALTQRHIARGMSPAAARRAALVEIGGVEQVKERVRDVRFGVRFETVRRDIACGVRTMRRSPGFALVVVGTLALCIGANVTMFSVMNAVLWRQLPYPDAERLVVVDADYRGTASAGISDGEAADLRAEPGLFDLVATLWRVDANLTDGSDYEQVAAASATDDAVQLLGGVPLAYGRSLEARRDHGADGYVDAVVISHELWRRRYNADPLVVGRHTQINNLDVEIVGVLPPGFRAFLPGNAAFPEVVDVWFPRKFEPADRRTRGPVTIARLAPGVSIEQAHTRVETLAGRFSTQYAADYNGMSFRPIVRPLHEVLTARARPALWALTAAVWFVLLIGCVNIANLMLARARVRAPEIAVRRALGAPRSRLIAQFFTESAVLTIIGAASGFLLAFAGLAFVEWLRPLHLPRQSQITIDGMAAAYTVALTVLVTLAFGVVPPLSAIGSSNAALRAARSEVQRAGMRRTQRALVVAEVALSIVPLVAAGLMLRTFINLSNAPIGFNPDDVVTAKPAVSVRLFQGTRAQLRLFETIMDRVRRLPGVEAVSAGGPLPLDDLQFIRTYGRVDEALPLVSRATMQSALPGYIAITGMTLRAGRDFTIDDMMNERAVVIIDERVATRLFPNGAVGQRMALDRGRKAAPVEIIGVTNAVRAMRVDDDSLPHILVPYHFYGLQMPLVIKTSQSAAALAPAMKQIAHDVGMRRPIHSIRPMQDYVDAAIADRRFTMLVLIGFGAASLLLAAIGVYGTLAYLTSQRRQEFGLRMALGASAGRILRSVAGEGLWLSALGGVVGIAGAAALASGLRDLLYDVAPFDVTTLVGVTALVAVASLLAAVHPAWRAAGVDPAATLRAE
jgi:putative ABC transport system permease protein